MDIETRSQIVDNFYERLQLSGYGHEQSVRIITSGLKGYENIRRNAAREAGNINRSEEEGRGERHMKKLLGKTNWFRSKKKTKQTEGTAENRNDRKWKRKQKTTEAQLPVVSVMFVPKTGGSILQKKLLDLEPGRCFLTAIGRSQDPVHAERKEALHSSLFQRFLCLKRILDLFTLENVKLIHACTLREAFKKKLHI